MKVLVLGATGATGRWVVRHLVDMESKVKVVVRSASRFYELIEASDKVTVHEASILTMDRHALSQYLEDCDAVISCLGHNLTLKGIFGPPWKLVTDAVKKVLSALPVKKDTKVRFILMNTTGNKNRDLDEPLSFGDKAILGLVRTFVPPQRDNEAAADALRLGVGRNHPILEWVAVRPDGLIDEKDVTEYTLHPSPIRSAVLNPGKTSRINVAHFMARLAVEDELWQEWKGQMPVIYNKEQS